MRHAGDDDDPKGELATPEATQPNATLIVLGGGHTTSTLLAGTLFYLLRSDDKLRRLEKEIRETFDSPNQVSFANVSQLPYLLAVLREALRIYSPVGIGIPCKTLPEGMAINGHFVPGEVNIRIDSPPVPNLLTWQLHGDLIDKSFCLSLRSRSFASQLPSS